MQLDLSFQDVVEEASFRRLRLALLRASGANLEWMRLAVSWLFVARLVLLHESLGAIAAALLACLVVGVQLWMLGMEKLRRAGGGGGARGVRWRRRRHAQLFRQARPQAKLTGASAPLPCQPPLPSTGCAMQRQSCAKFSWSSPAAI